MPGLLVCDAESSMGGLTSLLSSGVEWQNAFRGLTVKTLLLKQKQDCKQPVNSKQPSAKFWRIYLLCSQKCDFTCVDIPSTSSSWEPRTVYLLQWYQHELQNLSKMLSKYSWAALPELLQLLKLVSKVENSSLQWLYIVTSCRSTSRSTNCRLLCSFYHLGVHLLTSENYLWFLLFCIPWWPNNQIYVLYSLEINSYTNPSPLRFLMGSSILVNPFSLLSEMLWESVRL